MIDRVKQDIIRATSKLPLVYVGAGLDWYMENVRDFGFGYRIQHHAPYYQYLKRKAIEACVRDHKEHRLDRIAFITGVRRAESSYRAKRPILQRSGSRLTVNAIATYLDRDKIPYLKRATWYKGKTTHDCLCNWHARFKLSELEGSAAYEPICKLSKDMIDDGMWGYGQEPDSDWMVDDSTHDDMDSDSLCVDCLRQLSLFEVTT